MWQLNKMGAEARITRLPKRPIGTDVAEDGRMPEDALIDTCPHDIQVIGTSGRLSILTIT